MRFLSIYKKIIHLKIALNTPEGVDITLAPCEDTAVAVTMRGEMRKINS